MRVIKCCLRAHAAPTGDADLYDVSHAEWGWIQWGLLVAILNKADGI